MAMASSIDEEPPSWACLPPDVLASIFIKLSLEEILTVIPPVCSTWMRVSQDAACWQIVDLEDWSRRRHSHTVERLIKLLVSRSRGCLREFSVYGLKSDATLHFIARSGSVLQVLRIPYNAVSDDCVCQVTSQLPSITYLDISGGKGLSKVALESVGKQCRLITRLCMNRLVSTNDEVAFAVAQHMPQLRHLEMAGNTLLSNTGLKAVLDKCTNLEYLDVGGCWRLNMEEGSLKESWKRLKEFHDPDSGDDSDLSDDDPDPLTHMIDYYPNYCNPDYYYYSDDSEM